MELKTYEIFTPTFRNQITTTLKVYAFFLLCGVKALIETIKQTIK